MLRAQVLPVLLEQALSGGVHTACLLKPEGDIIGLKSLRAELEGDEEARIMLAIEVAGLWGNYAQLAAALPGGATEAQRPRCAIVNCDERTLCLSEVVPSELVLCLAATASTEAGLLRRKAKSLQEHLKGPLGRVIDQLERSGQDKEGQQIST
eukprot:TRINITY_DN32735_c0_g1_i1.p2 TRINITY_DN32735_c0_g1~~TRINITY_DN32735_c0_g1_i1.p2  ORF type:complete len:180 (+),score=65.40 TRINITY_DN32735_c0_g1_i1:84-542(+)